MVHPSLQHVIRMLTVAERLELRDFIDASLGAQAPDITEYQHDIAPERTAALDGDASTAISWDEVETTLVAEFG